MRKSQGLRVLVLVAVGLVLAGVAMTAPQKTSGDERAAKFGGVLPLFEPEWSPLLVLSGVGTYPALESPEALCAADVTGDENVELLVGGDYVYMLTIGDGEPAKHLLTILVGFGKFVGPGREVLRVRAIAVGDLDKDGLTDLVVATKAGQLWVLRNHGQWGFQWATGSPHTVAAEAVWLHDHNGDGNLDVLAGEYLEVRLLFGDGQGGLGEPRLLAGPVGRLRGGAAGAFQDTPGFFVLTDQGLWFFSQSKLQGDQVLKRGGRSLVVADLDGSGRVDVVVGDNRELRIYPGYVEGLGEPVVLTADHDVVWLLAADLNGDGWLDLVAGAFSPGGFSVYYNLTGQGFAGPYRYGVAVPIMRGLPASAPTAIAADLTGDGLADIAVATDLGHVAFFSPRIRGRSLQAIPGSFLLGSADLNRDGFPDLLANTTEGGIATLVNSGFGTFRAEPLVKASEKGRTPYLIRLADLTGDRVEELVVFEFAEDWVPVPQPGRPPWEWPQERSKARITVWDLAAKKVLWSQPLGKEIRPVLVLSDQTGDGVLDAVAAVGEKVIVLGHGQDEPLCSEIVWGGPVGPLVVLKDGTVAGLRVGKTVDLVLLQAGKVLETGISLEIAPLDMIVADLNSDENEDLVAIGWGTAEEKLAVVVAVMWGEGKGRFRPELFPLSDWPAMAIPFPYGGLVAADLDGDGKLELAAMRLPDQEGNPGGIMVIPWTETGPRMPKLLPGCVGTRLIALDVDGDGRAELLSVQTGIPAQLCLTAWR